MLLSCVQFCWVLFKCCRVLKGFVSFVFPSSFVAESLGETCCLQGPSCFAEPSADIVGPCGRQVPLRASAKLDGRGCRQVLPRASVKLDDRNGRAKLDGRRGEQVSPGPRPNVTTVATVKF